MTAPKALSPKLRHPQRRKSEPPSQRMRHRREGLTWRESGAVPLLDIGPGRPREGNCGRFMDEKALLDFQWETTDDRGHHSATIFTVVSVPKKAMLMHLGMAVL